MRVASFLAVGIAVTTTVIVVRHLSDRDHSGPTPATHSNSVDGTRDPTNTPTPIGVGDLGPGERLTISLSAKPATHYSSIGEANDTSEVAIAAAAGRGVYDASLSRAAAEMAIFGAVHRAAAPEVVTTFLLHASGAPDASAARYSLRTNDDDDGVIERAIDEALTAPPSGPGDLFFGVGEAATPSDPHARRIVVLMVRRAYRLEPTARAARLGAVWTARGDLPVGFSDASAKVLYPDGSLRDAAIEVTGRSFVLTVDTGTSAGTLHVGIDGVGADGPGKLLQLSVIVGRELPRELSVVLPESDPSIESIADAETYAAELLAIDRQNHGAPPLELDDELAEIAREHSVDMATAGFFGHQSPNTGLAGDRIDAAEYRASSFAENLAKNDSLAEAESSLLGSVGHRANLLSHDFSHVGIGVAKSIERGRTQWYVTQLFARKTVPIDGTSLVESIYNRITDARAKGSVDRLQVDSTLEAVAREGAKRAADGDTDNIASKLGRRARDLTRRSVLVSVQVIYTESQLVLPKDIGTDETIDAIGVSVSQSETDRAGRIGVVIITARPR